MESVLEIENLHTRFYTSAGVVRAVDGVTCELRRGEVLGIVGESGCGKSVTAMSVLRLIPDPPGRIAAGSIRFHGTELLGLSEEQMQRIRGNEISMIFQEPMTSLHPIIPIGTQISEALSLHKGYSNARAWEKAVDMLRLVQIPEPERRAHEYPHQISGGMRQRVMIAMALSCEPQVLIADEPTTALDVTIQAQILELMRELQREMGTAIMLITHDMGVIAENAQRVIVMYAGKKVEEASVQDLFEARCHPYTEGLLGSLPRLDLGTVGADVPPRLQEIPGIVPPLHDLPPGCAFAPRCPQATEKCHLESPPFEEVRPKHWAACWHSRRLLEQSG